MATQSDLNEGKREEEKRERESRKEERDKAFWE